MPAKKETDDCKGKGGKAALARLLKGRRSGTLDDPVDAEIAPVIAALNALPFVRSTIYSCAGYGRGPRSSRHPAGSDAYLVLSYCEGSSARAFHGTMKRISASTSGGPGILNGAPYAKSVRTYFATPLDLGEAYFDATEGPPPLRSRSRAKILAAQIREANRQFWTNVLKLAEAFADSTS